MAKKSSEKAPLLQPQFTEPEEDEEGEVKEPQPSTLRSIKFLLSHGTSKDRTIFMLCMFCALVHGIAQAALTVLWGKTLIAFLDRQIAFIEQIFGPQLFYGNIDMLYNLPSAIGEDFEQSLMEAVWFGVALGGVILVSSYIHVTFAMLSVRRMSMSLRKVLMSQILRQNMNWFQTKAEGEVTSVLNEEIEIINDAIGYRLSLVVCDFATLVGAIIVAFLYNWRLALLLMFMVPIIVAVPVLHQIYFSVYANREHQTESLANAIVSETFTYIKTVIMFNGQRRSLQNFETVIKEGVGHSRNKNLSEAIAQLVLSLLAYGLTFGFGFWYGSRLVATGSLEARIGIVVTLIAFVGAVILLNTLASHLSVISKSVSILDNMDSIVKNIPSVDAYSMTGVVPIKAKGAIEFCDVSFSYPSRPDCKVLDNVTFTVEPGEHVAIVGASGAGKSTIVSLLLRFFEPESGAIHIDSANIRSLNVQWLRTEIGYVSQTPVLFDWTIAENIAFRDDDGEIAMDDIQEATMATNCYASISALPQGFKTRVGQHGGQLSEAQKQCVCIARAFVRKPKILLFDEATSSMDAQQAAVVQNAIDRVSKGVTTVTITHRIDLIKNVDKIVVLENGRVVEIGSQEELLKKEKGVFSRMAQADVDFDSGLAETESESETLTPQLTLSSTSSIYEMVPSTIVTSKTQSSTYEYQKSSPKTNIASLVKTSSNMWKMLLGLFGSVVSVVLKAPIFALLVGDILLLYLETPDTVMSGAPVLALKFVAIGVGIGAGTGLTVYFLNGYGDQLVLQLRLRLFQHLLRNPLTFFEKPKHSSGILSRRLATDSANVRSALGNEAADLVSYLIAAVIALIIALCWEPLLGIECFVVIFPLLLIGSYVDMKQNMYRQPHNIPLLEQAASHATEVVTNIEIVQAYGMERKLTHIYSQQLDRIKATRQAHLSGLAFGFVHAIVFIMFSVTIKVSVNFAMADEAPTPPEVVIQMIMLFIFTGIQLADAFNSVAKVMNGWQCSKEIFKLLSEEVAFDNMSDAGITPSVTGSVSMSDVYFYYPRRTRDIILRQINFQVEAGTTVAIVGPAGCGKSTLLSLMQRLYDPIGGSVKVDKSDVRVMNVGWLRDFVVCVPQDPVLFDCSIGENICYGVEGLTGEQVIEAAKLAGIHDFIVSLPEGYGTPVGQTRTKLSGGQKQRVCIARALIRKPAVLLLDNATASLDNETEQAVQNAMKVVGKNCTVVLVTNKVSAVRNADFVIVFDKKAIVQQGAPAELLEKAGPYSKMFASQMR